MGVTHRASDRAKALLAERPEPRLLHSRVIQQALNRSLLNAMPRLYRRTVSLKGGEAMLQTNDRITDHAAARSSGRPEANANANANANA